GALLLRALATHILCFAGTAPCLHSHASSLDQCWSLFLFSFLVEKIYNTGTRVCLSDHTCNLGPYHFNVLAFPCNQFGQQEPGSDKEIDSFVRRVYGVSFPRFSKIAVVRTGANNVYKYLVESSGKEPDWNFWKYLIDVNGKVVDAWGPDVSV
uniref:Glutathione peroxidase n=2 Tax=Monopterus albus TaxID=43700 RepID=A0A3Q3IN23_MONAL